MPAFEADLAKFAGYNAQVVGISTDSVPCHIAFQKSSDKWPHGQVAKAYGIFPAAAVPQLGINERAVFIVDKDGKLAWSKIYDLKDQPDIAEVLDALRKIA
jgi:peroxiredoxin